MKALLFNDASLAGHHGSALVTERLKDLAKEVGIDVVTGWDWESALAACQASSFPFDLVIVNGEGSIHHDSKSARRIAALAGELRAKGIPAYLVNATVESCTTNLLAGLGAYRAVFVRDSKSQSVLRAAGVNASLVHDLTLSFPAPTTGYNPSGPLLLTDASEQQKTAQLIELHKRWSGSQMITLRSPPPRPNRGRRLRSLAFRLKRLAASHAALSPWSLRYAHALASREELVTALASSSGLIAARYHAVCIALVLEVPFIAVEGNTGKTSALLSDIGLKERRVDLNKLAAMKSAPLIPAFDAGERDAIRAFLAQTRAGAEKMLNDIAADARTLGHERKLPAPHGGITGLG